MKLFGKDWEVWSCWSKYRLVRGEMFIRDGLWCFKRPHKSLYLPAHGSAPCLPPMYDSCYDDDELSLGKPPIKYFLSEELPRLWWLFIAIEQWLRPPLLFFHWLSTVVEGSLRKPRSSWKSSKTLLFLLFIRPQFTRGLSQMPTILTTSLINKFINLIYELPTLNV